MFDLPVHFFLKVSMWPGSSTVSAWVSTAWRSGIGSGARRYKWMLSAN